MKVVILAGGFGTRLSEETDYKPKPMSEIGNMPILWHIMKLYSFFGLKKFIILAGYKSFHIKKFFNDFFLYENNIKFHLNQNKFEILNELKDQWQVEVLETGIETMTGGRILRAKLNIENDDDDEFCLTYGDCIADVKIDELIKFHRNKKKIATLTGIIQPSRYGSIDLEKDDVKSFSEKPINKENFINGGFFVLNKKVFNYLKNDQTIFEKEPLSNLAKDNQLSCYKHQGFWHPMDTLKDKRVLDELWRLDKAPWKKYIK